MKKQLILLTAALFSFHVFGQIQQNDTTICVGDTIQLSASSNTIFQSCTGESAINYTTWTAIAPTDSYTNIIKEGTFYYLRSQNNVYQSSSLNGPWTSMNFNTQVGNTLAGKMLGLDWNDRIVVSTGHNSLYAYGNGTWADLGLGGFGCSGNFIHKLPNNRIIVMKGGFMRDLYISDNNGTSWNNVTNVDNDYWEMIVAPNGNIYACGGSNTPSMTGLIKSTNNGSSFTQINAQLGISYCSGFGRDCQGSIYAVADNKIFKSIDGTTWAQECLIPAYFNSNPGYSYFIAASNGDYYLYGYASPTLTGLFKSSNQGQTWTQITDLPTATVNVFNMKEIDGNIVVATTQGIFAKTLQSNYSYLWSTGATTPSIQVSPTTSSEYTLQTTFNNSTTTDTILVSVSMPPNAGTDQTICYGDTAVLLATGASTYQWTNNVQNGVGFIPTSTSEYIVTGTDAFGCQGLDSVLVTVNDVTSSTQTQTALDSYTWPVNGQTYTQSGQYTDTLLNAAGCDSIITLNLSLTFTGQNELETIFSVAPNPATNLVTITTQEARFDAYTLMDAQGRIIQEGKLKGTSTLLDLSRMARGNYFLRIGHQQTVLKLVKE